MKNFYKETENGIILSIKVIPNASKTQIILSDETENRLKIRLCAPANENKANDELIKFLSKSFKVPKTCIKILSGEKCRDKKVFLPISYNQLTKVQDFYKKM